MSYRTNPDRILDNIDRARNRAAESAGLSVLGEGQKVSYELQPGRDGKSSAENLSVID